MITREEIIQCMVDGTHGGYNTPLDQATSVVDKAISLGFDLNTDIDSAVAEMYRHAQYWN